MTYFCNNDTFCSLLLRLDHGFNRICEPEAANIAMIAVIKTGGKQYLVEEGKTLNIEKLEKEIGDKIEFDAMLVADAEGKDVKVGTPTTGVNVIAEVLEQGKEKKVSVVKYKSKSRYRRNVGHRQPYTKIKIEKIG